MRLHAALAAAALCLAGASLAQQHLPAVHQRPPEPKTGPPARQSDAQIEAAIRAKMAKSKIGADKFTFHVQGGVATIEGKTDVIQHKGSATRMAKSAGAIAVKNHIEISEAAKAKAAANLEQGRRRAQIKRGEPRSSGSSVRTAVRTPPATANPDPKTTAKTGKLP